MVLHFYSKYVKKNRCACNRNNIFVPMNGEMSIVGCTLYDAVFWLCLVISQIKTGNPETE